MRDLLSEWPVLLMNYLDEVLFRVHGRTKHFVLRPANTDEWLSDERKHTEAIFGLKKKHF